MDKKQLIKNLHQLFCDKNKSEKKYSKVWLSDVDYGGLYQSDKYVLNILAEHDINSCNSEIIDVLSLLKSKAESELHFIQRVNVYHSNDEEDVCESPDLLIYEEANACE